MTTLKWMLALAVTLTLGFNALALEGEDYSDLTSDGKQILSDDSLAQELELIEPTAQVPDPASTTPASHFTPTPGDRKPASKLMAKNKTPKESGKKAKKESKKDSVKKVAVVKKNDKGGKVKREVASAHKEKHVAKKSKDKKSKKKKS